MGTRRIKRKIKSSHSKSTNPKPPTNTIPFFLVKEKVKTIEDCIELFSNFYSMINVAPESAEKFQNSPLGKFYERKEENEEKSREKGEI